MKIRGGLIGTSTGWRELLNQEGFPFETVDGSDVSPEEYSVLVIGRELTEEENSLVLSYLRKGGAVLGFSGHMKGIPGCAGYEARVEYLVPGGESGTSQGGILLLDLSARCVIPREANRLRTHDGRMALFAGETAGGFVVALPFDPATMLFDERPANRRFAFDRERLPSERVSAVAKGEIHHLVHWSLEFLHHSRGIPYVHLWYFPPGTENIFAYRIDTDGAPRSDIETLHQLAREYNLPLSWYVDVRSHEEWLERFAELGQDEVSLHCYEHTVFETGDANLENLRRGIAAMERIGVHPRGFAAPYGIWNRALAGAMEECGFEYSSEFSYGYDALPFTPGPSGMSVRTLQVPVHPVCIGSMLRVGYSEELMLRYYRTTVQRKVARREPLLFYHHPSHRCWRVVDELFRSAHENGWELMTLADIASWWKKREKVHIVVRLEDGDLSFGRTDGSDPSSDAFGVEISRPDGYFRIAALSEPTISVKGGRWSERLPFSVPSDVAGLRDFDLRSSIADIYSTFIRKFR